MKIIIDSTNDNILQDYKNILKVKFAYFVAIIYLLFMFQPPPPWKQKFNQMVGRRSTCCCSVVLIYSIVLSWLFRSLYIMSVHVYDVCMSPSQCNSSRVCTCSHPWTRSLSIFFHCELHIPT